MKRVLGYEPAEALAHLRASDPVLGELIDRVGAFGLEPRKMDSLFEALLRAIVYQQLHGKAAASIHARVLTVLEKHGGARPEILVKVADDDLRAAGLSRSKLAAIRDLAEKAAAGLVPTVKEAAMLTDEELIERLTVVRGIGPWTVHMLLIFNLGRGDVMPTGDYAIRAAFRRLYRKRKEPSIEGILRHARRWQPYRSVASWYLWRSLDVKT